MALGRIGRQHLPTPAHQAQTYRQMLDEIREQRFLACHLRIEGVLIAGARSLHGAGLTGRGTRQLRPPPISSESLTIGGDRARLRVAEGADRHR